MQQGRGAVCGRMGHHLPPTAAQSSAEPLTLWRGNSGRLALGGGWRMGHGISAPGSEAQGLLTSDRCARRLGSAAPGCSHVVKIEGRRAGQGKATS